MSKSPDSSDVSALAFLGLGSVRMHVQAVAHLGNCSLPSSVPSLLELTKLHHLHFWLSQWSTLVSPSFVIPPPIP